MPVVPVSAGISVPTVIAAWLPHSEQACLQGIGQPGVKSA